MTQIQTSFDFCVSLFWTLTYLLALVSTLVHRHPAISPVTQAIIAPVEFSVLLNMFLKGNFDGSYVSSAYLCWAVLELILFAVILAVGKYPARKVCLFLALFAVVAAATGYCVICRGQGLFSNYFNTLIGEVIWLFHILKPDYPMKTVNLMAFLTKLAADMLAVPVYFFAGTWIISVMCIALPVVDLLFLAAYFEKRVQMNRRFGKKTKGKKRRK